MLESATEGKFDYIITKCAKRVSRNTVELLQIMRYLKERGTQMYFEIENVNSFDPDAEAAITLSGAMGQEESRNLSENIQWGIKRNLRKDYLAVQTFYGVSMCGRRVGNRSGAGQNSRIDF